MWVYLNNVLFLVAFLIPCSAVFTLPQLSLHCP